MLLPSFSCLRAQPGDPGLTTWRCRGRTTVDCSPVRGGTSFGAPEAPSRSPSRLRAGPERPGPWRDGRTRPRARHGVRGPDPTARGVARRGPRGLPGQAHRPDRGRLPARGGVPARQPDAVPQAGGFLRRAQPFLAPPCGTSCRPAWSRLPTRIGHRCLPRTLDFFLPAQEEKTPGAAMGNEAPHRACGLELGVYEILNTHGTCRCVSAERSGWGCTRAAATICCAR